ncbi:MAG TPA: SpoIID/LytB domain-containing protein [Gemmatimonadaceae bacterium]
MKRVLATFVVAAVMSCTTTAPEPVPVSTPIPVTAPPSRGTVPPSTAPAPKPTSAPTTPPPASTAPPTVLTTPRRANAPVVRDAGDTLIRVLLAGSGTARIASPGGLMLTNRDGAFIARVGRGETWRVESSGRQVRAIGSGAGTQWTIGPMYARPIGAALLSVGGKPYRGDLALFGSDSGVMVVNVVKIDDYVRGVVPLEIGTKSTEDSAAVQAQAVTARSYAYIHLSPSRNYDVTSGVIDQVYGGVEVETAVASEAVESTRTLVLMYAGRVVNAPYHSTCGGSTAAASEVWRSSDEPYLRPVSDQIPGRGRYYCDIAPRFRWARTLEAPTLNAALAQYLATYTSVPNRTPGAARAVTVTSHTSSGRVNTVNVTTDRGNFTLRGNDIRFVLRQPGGEILNSTYFSVEPGTTADGALARVTIRGMGNGHGVGMCQWGAIGRARAGQDFRTILRTYYPGTTVGSAN